MEDVQIKLSAIWVAVMLTYLLGDVLRIFSGDFKAGQIGELQASQWMYLLMAGLMVIPILMVVLTLVLSQPVNRWANIIVAAFWFLFNLVGLPTYTGYYDRFLLGVSMALNLITIWYAWNWV